MLNVRLDSSTEEELNSYCQQKGISKSSIVKEALAMYFTKEQSQQLPHTLGQDLFGAASSGQSNKSANYKQQLKDKLRDKHAH